MFTPDHTHLAGQINLAPIPKALMTEGDAAAYLGFAIGTLRVWRTKSRRANRLVGPPWIEIGGDGRRKSIRYRLVDLDGYAAAGAVALRRRGRPRKSGG